jgi:multicomponent Na+:H+ antiporter subunit E
VTAAVWRGAGFALLWLLLAGADLADLPAAIVAIAAATWASLYLLPQGTWQLSPAGLARLALRFPRQSVIAGVDVARRVVDPALPLRPGYISYRPLQPDGTARDAFCTWVSLLPGTLPIGSQADGTILIHCLDTDQPIAAQLAAEEAVYLRAIGRGDA